MRYFDVVSMFGEGWVTVHEPRVRLDCSKGLEHHPFMFDAVFDESSTSEEVYTVRVHLPAVVLCHS